MSRKELPIVSVLLEKIVGGGQALGTLDDGRKIFVWGGLPTELASVQITKKKSHLAEGIVLGVEEASPERTKPRDPESYLSTSPWQIMDLNAEQHYKSALIEEAFELHDIVLPDPIDIYTDNKMYEYRNKVEYSWYWDKESDSLELAFFRRGTHGKIPVDNTSLAHPAITHVARDIRDILRARNDIKGYMLKTLLVRCNQAGEVIAQLYTKEEIDPIDENLLSAIRPLVGFELIFSEPKSPASVITKRLQAWGQKNLTDTILGIPFSYATEGFFQINLPVYEQALRDMSAWVDQDKPLVDMYSGVGTIGLTIGSSKTSLIEINESAVEEMEKNIVKLGKITTHKAIHAPSEKSLDCITGAETIILDPPRAGLHESVIAKILAVRPSRIIYLSCNPVTQARDTALLGEVYGIRSHRGYNFFPRTPHIEHLVVLELK